MKKILMICLCIFAVSANSINARAEHITGDGTPCNNTYVLLQDNNLVSTYTGTHNYTCTVTYYVYSHAIKCSACKTYLGQGFVYNCTQSHTCGSYLKDCGGVHEN